MPGMTRHPLVAVFVTGAIFAASIGGAHGQQADPVAPAPPQAATPAPAPVPAPNPPPGTPYPPPGTPYQPPGGPYQQPPQIIYVPQEATWPRYIKDWDEGQPVPYGYHPEARARKGLVIPGAIIAGVAYLLATLVATEHNDSYDSESYNAMFIPIVGPFIQMGTGNNVADDDQALFLDGMAQAAGVTMLVLGLAFPRHILVRNDFGSISFVPTPIRVGHEGGGLGLVGRF
jgi:hypothetical protein